MGAKGFYKKIQNNNNMPRKFYGVKNNAEKPFRKDMKEKLSSINKR